MSIQRIESKAGWTKGWQARVYTFPPLYLSEFFADKKNGGSRKARKLAKQAEARLKIEAARVRGSS